MPLYEYECEACGHRFEQIQKFSDAPLEECPSCGKKALHKLVSSPAIKFKGSGWYINDYAKKDAPGSSKTASKDEKAEKSPAGDAGKSSTASETPAAAPAATPSKDS